MSVDLQQFHRVYFEESQEHLDTMEHLLMTLDLDQPDEEQLNSIFRAAHSIKGGSGIFGFEALGSVTHVMETLLDKMRKGNLAPTSDIVDGLLRAVDSLSSLLVCYRAEQPIDWNLVASATAEVEALDVDRAPQPSEAKDQAYGLFDDPVLPDAPEQAWGLFGDSEPDVNTASPSGEGSDYGFFDVADTPSEAQTDSAAYGFFTDPDEIAKPDSDAPAEREADKKAQSPAVTPSAASARKAQAAPSKNKALGKKSVAPSATESSSIRVDVDKVDKLINLVGELVITQSMLAVLGNELEEQQAERMQSVLGELERNTREIQESVMSIRMLPVSFVFNRFPRVVRDLSQKLNKDIELEIEGGNTELDKGLIEKLVDPLTHLVRNSIDHGIEAPDERLANGKPKKGRVLLSASQQGGNIIIGIHDDGAGLNRDKILQKAAENDLNIPDNATDEQVWDLIFQPGFSTAAQVTDVSGRGVGMDVVKRNIHSLGGRIEVSSQRGEGSVFTIVLPLTLAIVDGMGVRVGDQTYIIPLVNIVESMQPRKEDIKTLGNDMLLHVRDYYWPVLPLYERMDVAPDHAEPSEAIIVLVETSKRRFGLLVDELAGQQQVVIKSLEQHYRRVPGVAGATIMGDGSVALILDVESLASTVTQPNQMEEIA